MRGHRRGGTGSGRARIAATIALAALLPAAAAQAQYYDVGPRGYDRGPPAYADDIYEERVYRRVPRRAEGGPVGFNCAAVQQGLSGPQPYSCPLPGPRPVGARCYCDLPIASFSPAQTAVGSVVR